MSCHERLSPAEKLLAHARLRVEACREELRDLLAGAREGYAAALSELDTLVGSSSSGDAGRVGARLETLQRSQSLHQTAGELDVGIARLGEALEALEEAGGALEGDATRPAARRRLLETSLEMVAIQAQEEERYRLSREIHDGPAQIMANLALQLEYISKLADRDPGRVKDELNTIQKDLRLAVGEVRRFMYDLRPPALAQQGVGPAVESHCQRLSERFGLKIQVAWESASALLPSHDTAVFRIVQEALQNVVKHARATRVEVRAVEREGALEVSVADDGKGFHPEMVHRLDPKHFGLSGMRARAQQIGAGLEVSSHPDRGTTVLLRVPLA